MSIHEEEVLGKAYDARLMRRLLGYLRPYSAQVAIALAAIISGSILQLAQPWLMKVAIDRYIAAPFRLAPKTSMSFPGLPDAQERADLVAFLETVK